MKCHVVAAILALFLVGEVCGERCWNDDDCAEDECCVAKALGMFIRKGNCKKLGQLDEDCHDNDEHTNSLKGKHLLHCPCASGLTCVPGKTIKVPIIGEVILDEKCKQGETTTEPQPEPGTEEPTQEPEPETEEPTPEPEPEPEEE